MLKWLLHTGPASTHYGAPRQPFSCSCSELPFQESDPLRFHPRNSHPVCVKQLLVSNYMRHTYKEVHPDVPPCSAWREISICGDKQNGGNKVQINCTNAEQLELLTRRNNANKQIKQTKPIRWMQKLIQRGAYLHSLGSNFPKDQSHRI